MKLQNRVYARNWYFYSLGVEQSNERAEEWYKKADALGMIEAKVGLANIYITGEWLREGDGVLHVCCETQQRGGNDEARRALSIRHASSLLQMKISRGCGSMRLQQRGDAEGAGLRRMLCEEYVGYPKAEAVVVKTLLGYKLRST